MEELRYLIKNYFQLILDYFTFSQNCEEEICFNLWKIKKNYKKIIRCFVFGNFDNTNTYEFVIVSLLYI